MAGPRGWPKGLAQGAGYRRRHLNSLITDMSFSLSFFITLATAMSKSSWVTWMRRSRRANMPASVQTAYTAHEDASAHNSRRRTHSAQTHAQETKRLGWPGDGWGWRNQLGKHHNTGVRDKREGAHTGSKSPVKGERK